MSPAGPVFAVVAVTLLIAHTVADHWIQTGQQVRDKGLPGWPGRIACAQHVLTYTIVTAGGVAAVWVMFGLPITWAGFVAGQVVSAVTHYWADRRFTLEWFTTVAPLRWMGKHEFYRLGQPRRVVGVRVTSREGRETVRPYRSSRDHEPTGLELPWDNPAVGTGAYHLDQAWHIGWLGVAAVLTALL